jgi:hypothetical protein
MMLTAAFMMPFTLHRRCGNIPAFRRGGGLAGLDILNEAIAKSESGERFRFRSEDRIKSHLHGEPLVLANHTTVMKIGFELFSTPHENRGIN